MRLKLFTPPVVLLLLAACSNPKGEAEAVIRQYDQALIKAFGSGNPAPLKDIAGEKELRKVGTLIDYKGTAGLVLESQLLNLSMDSCSKTGDDAMTATSTERWSYFDRPQKAGAAPGKTVESEMKLKYFLKKENGVWKVEKVEGISQKTLDQKK
jgi:hypothetical protein